jgi:hypothetical protein
LRAFERVLVLKVSLIASNSVCFWKQPFREEAGIEEAKVEGSVGSLQLPESSRPSKT